MQVFHNKSRIVITCNKRLSTYLQEEVESSWHWVVATSLLVGFVSALPWLAPLLGYFAVVGLAQMLQGRVCQAPLLAMFSINFLD